MAKVATKGRPRTRAAASARSKSSNTRPKLRSQTATSLKDTKLNGGLGFLDLPAELRNNIYEYATEYAFRCFPTLHRRCDRARERLSDYLAEAFEDSDGPEQIHIPYLGLTQTCAQIRAEFRPMWLSTHKIPLSYVNAYLKAFFPLRLPKAIRIKHSSLVNSTLRIFVRRENLITYHLCDVTRLIKHKARHPNCTITCLSLPNSQESVLHGMERILNHDNGAWMHSVGSGRFSQIRIGVHEQQGTRGTSYTMTAMDVVVKERFAESWMKPSYPNKDDVDRFLEQFGFIRDGSRWHVRLYVDYS